MHALVVDDDLMTRQLVVVYLTDNEHTIDTVTDGQEGIEKFRADRFDLIIMDRAMLEMNGDQLTTAIKQITTNKPVIMLTGFGDMRKFIDEYPENVDIILSKPVTLTKFREALAKMSQWDSQAEEV